MSGGRIAKIVSSFSLALLVVVAFGDDYRELKEKVSNLKDPGQVARVVASAGDLMRNDPQLRRAAHALADGDDQVERVKSMIDLRAAAEGSPSQADPSAQAKAIKSSGFYRDPGVQDQSNWLDGALKRLADLMPRPSVNAGKISASGGGIADFLIPVMWTLLAAAVLIFGYLAIRHFQWKGALRRKAKAVLEEGEPERTLDEWLLLADQLTKEERYREAVRALYLSCLLKFDEAGIARFVRGETNWEHLARIQSSLKRPARLDFLPPTQLFDRVWYGHHVRGVEDVSQFKDWYGNIVEILREVAA